MSTDNFIADSIKPKSDQLNADDLLTGPITVTVQGVRKGAADQPVIVDIGDGHQPYKPCKSMRRVMSTTWGTDATAWVGQSLTLFCDPNVKWAGQQVGGIRISHITGIGKPQTLKLTETRGKKQPFTVEPLQAIQQPSASIEDRIARAAQAYAQATTAEQIDKLATKCEPLFAELNDEQKANLQQIHEASLRRVQG